MTLQRSTHWKTIGASFAALLAFCGALATAPARADDPRAAGGSSAALAAKFATLKNDLANSPFKRPIVLTSREGSDVLAGDVYALVDHPFATASAALNQPAQWCDVLILHLNTKYCKPQTENGAPQLQVAVGKKHDQPIENAHRVDFDYKVVARTDNYLQVKLNADQGPMGTRNYRIILEAAPANANQTYLRLSYSYGFGTMAQIAMKAYLNTIARNKVGFTVVGQTPDGQPQAIGGMRGVVERNTMRYYLAIEAYLGAHGLPPSQRAEKSFRDWYMATENYPRQLREMDQSEYLSMKRKEYQRQQGQS